MKTLNIDIETYSSVDLTKCGVYRYAESPDFEILLFGYTFDDEPVRVIDLTDELILPEDIINALFDRKIQKCAFNAQFERTCLAAYLGYEMPPEQWSCTAVMARELGLPGSLEGVGAALGLSEDKKKLSIGKSLIRYFSKPCAPTKTNGGRTRNLPEHDPDKWDSYIEYNRQDVASERHIRKILSRFRINPKEQYLWCLDQKINDRGVKADIQLAENAVIIETAHKEALIREAQELMGLSNPNSVSQIKTFIEERTGLTVDSLDKKSLPGLKDAVDDKDVKRILDIRAGLSKTSVKKYEAVLRTVNADGRIRGLTQFYGASRTGRWAGRLVQMQNLPQNKLPEEELDAARTLAKRGDAEMLNMLYEDLPGTLSQLIRTAFVPKEGHKFVVADFSAIEARVLAWVAKEKWRLEVFNSHGKIYEASAEQMFHLPPGSVKKGDPMRQKGKIAELALGYGGSVGALTAMGALDMGLTEDELKPLVNKWRSANHRITTLWWAVGDAAQETVRTGAVTRLRYGIEFRKEGPLLRLRLPSGRELAYVRPALDDNGITYYGSIQGSGSWGKIESYGPKLVENLIQAIARDCLAEALLRLEAAGYPVVFHVHDEAIVEVPINGGPSAEDIANIMSEPIEWAPDLPLKADAYECTYYKKD